MLGGGGVRGLAHIGVLAELERVGIVPDVLVGVSMGALVAATYAARLDWEDALDRVDRSRLPSWSDPREDAAVARLRTLVRNARALAPSVWTWGRQGYEEYGRNTLQTLLGGCKTFDQTRLPLAVTATDLDRGERVILRDGELIGAALASGAIPGLSRPVDYDGLTLIDGGFSDPAPVDVARDLGAEVVVAINVGQHPESFDTDNWALTVLRGLEISQRKFAEARLAAADLVLRPDFGERVIVLDFSAADDVIRAGRVCALRRLPDVQALLEA